MKKPEKKNLPCRCALHRFRGVQQLSNNCPIEEHEFPFVLLELALLDAKEI